MPLDLPIFYPGMYPKDNYSIACDSEKPYISSHTCPSVGCGSYTWGYNKVTEMIMKQ